MDPRLDTARLYLLLTRSLCRRPPLEVLLAALAGGVDLVQVREKSGSDAELEPYLEAVLEIAHGRDVPVIVNDRFRLAKTTLADGVHLGQRDAEPVTVRRALGPERWIGWSTHDASQIAASKALPIDYLGLGPLFDTATKGLIGLGPAVLGPLLRDTERPIFGIGGVTVARLPEIRSAGFERVAISSAVCASDDPGEAAAALRRVLDGPISA